MLKKENYSQKEEGKINQINLMSQLKFVLKAQFESQPLNIQQHGWIPDWVDFINLKRKSSLQNLQWKL